MTGYQFAVDQSGWASDDARLARTVLSLERVRFELRIPEGDTAQDVMLRELCASAVSAASVDLDMPILTESVTLDIPADCIVNEVLEIDDPVIRVVNSVRYSVVGNSRVFAGPVSATRATDPDNGGPEGSAVIEPPVTGWPVNAAAYRVGYDRGIPAPWSEIDALKSMLVQRIRAEYDGVASLPGTRTLLYERMRQTLRSWRQAPAGLRRIAA